MVKVGQIGVGYWGKNLLRNFVSLQNCEVEIACDLSPEALDRVRRDYPGVRVTSEVRDVMNSDIDAVVIAASAAAHYPLAKAALEAGKDVFVEKPMALDLREGEELVELAEGAGRVLMVGHLMEYHPAVVQLKGYIDGGELGDIYYIYSTRVNLGRIRRDENALWSFAPHDISMITFLLGDEPREVTAVGRSYITEGIEDVAFLSLLFENGVMAHIHVSWLDPHKVRKLTVVGSSKMAVFDDMEAPEFIRIYDKGVDQSFDYETYGESLTLRSGDILIPKVRMSEPLKIECLHFLECVENRTRPRSDGRDGLRVLKVLDAAQRSLEGSGVPVEI